MHRHLFSFLCAGLILPGAMLLSGCGNTPASADSADHPDAPDIERVDHFKGLPAANWDQALSNLGDYNQRLAAIVTQNQLSPADLNTVHELTYTLENAIERIQHELNHTAEILEEVHQGSERGDFDGVRDNGRRYLDASARFLGKP